MKLIKSLLCIALSLCLITTNAYSFSNEISNPSVNELQLNIKEKYGINIIISDEDSEINYEDFINIIDYSLSLFPEGVIKEITDSYSNEGIKTNIIIQKPENNVINFPGKYLKTDREINIYINVLSNNIYGTSSSLISLNGITHELGHFVSEYLFHVYGYEKLENEFSKLNNGLEYGTTWKEEYNNSFVNHHSAASLKDDISDLIWYAETHPENLRNINQGNIEIIHKKIQYLALVFDNIFKSVSEETRLWLEAVPSKPDSWSKDVINKMILSGLIPKEYEGVYKSYITKEDFYVLVLNSIKNKLGEDEFYKKFNIVKPEKFVKIDPVTSEVIIDDGIPDIFYDIDFCNNKEDIYEAYQIGLIHETDGVFSPQSPITRLEAIKLFTFLCERFGLDISSYKQSDYVDMLNVNNIEKPYVYFAVSNGILKGDGRNLKPFEYCTYQEAYIMLNRVLKLI